MESANRDRTPPAPESHNGEASVTRSARKRRVAIELFVADTTMLVVAVLGATLAESGGLHAGASEWLGMSLEHPWLSIGTVACLLTSMLVHRLYDMDYLGWGSGEFKRVAQALGIGIFAVVLVTFAIQLPDLSRGWIVLVWLLSTGLVTASRLVLRSVHARPGRSTWLRRPTLIVGSNTEAAEISRILKADRTSDLDPVGCLSTSLKDKLSLDFCSPNVPALGSARDLVDVVRDHDIDTVVIVGSAFDNDVLQRMICDLRDVPVCVQMTSSLSGVVSSRVRVRAVSGIPVISLQSVSLSEANLRAKRLFDLVVSGALILLGMPLWILVALAIKLTSRGPVLYAQERIGKKGRPLLMYKFRSMREGADGHVASLDNEADGPLFKMKEDPRVTSVGRWMRKFSIDEFPQLLNVAKGELSLVGPRPPLPREVVSYSSSDWKRLEVTPGMTGLWQVSGRSNLGFSEMVRLDLFYIENWSVRMDLALLARTVPAVISAKGAY